MAEPCCPDYAGRRGAPYTPHWFVVHDEHGAIDVAATLDLGGLPASDLELSTSVKGMHETARHFLLYGSQSKNWYIWNGSGRFASQRADFGIRMTRMAAAMYRQASDDTWQAIRDTVYAQPEAQRDRALKEAEQGFAPYRAFRAKIWNDAGQKAIRSQISEAVSIDMELMDAGTGRIVVDNGVLDFHQVIRDGIIRLLPHDPGDLVTRRCGPGVRWEPDARAPAFERFLHESVADADQRFWLCWRTCCALFGLMERKGFVNLIGERDSGKSTFTDVISWLAGDYARTVPVETFLSKHAGDAGFRQHDLMGARFVCTHEPNPGALYDVSFMKTITGRDRQRTAAKYEKPITWTPQCTPFIGSNGPIRFSTADDAMVSRQEAIRFARGYRTPDAFLAERLRAELPGILRMLMDSAVWQAELGRVPDLPVSVIAERERLAVQTEDALEFVTEWIAEGRLREDSQVPSYLCAQVQVLYSQYRYWCEDAGVRPVGRKTFSAVLGRKYPPSQSGGRYRFTGLVAAG